MTTNPLDIMMDPSSVAIIGASAREFTVGNIILKNLINLRYGGRIYPVNPKYKEIFGIKCYNSVLDIPGNIDVAIIAIPANSVPHVLNDCGLKGIKHVIILSSGFAEVGGEGIEINREMLSVALKYGIRIIGPNTTGLLNLEKGFTSTFILLKREYKPGNVSFIAQTGVFAATMLRWIFTGEKFRLNKVIGLGNKVDIDDADALEYLRRDPNTKVIIIYMEGLKNGRRFFDEAYKTSLIKPVIVVKAGRTALGARASMSHTGSVAIPSKVFDGLCRQAGIIRVDDLMEAFDLAKIFSFYSGFGGDRVAIASYSGAECVISADAATKYNLELANLGGTLDEISKFAPFYWPKNHPVDLGPILESENPAEGVEKTINLILSNKEVDILILIFPVMAVDEGRSFIEAGAISGVALKERLSTFREKYPDKAIITILDGSKMGYDEGKSALESIGIPVYKSVDSCFKALSKAIWWWKWSRNKKGL